MGNLIGFLVIGLFTAVGLWFIFFRKGSDAKAGDKGKGGGVTPKPPKPPGFEEPEDELKN